jgi:hypothetical protein
MKVTQRTRQALAFRREERELTKQGYRRHETDWEINCGFNFYERIVDVKISVDGRYVYTKLGDPNPPKNTEEPMMSYVGRRA